jgi:hypothetical protein
MVTLLDQRLQQNGSAEIDRRHGFTSAFGGLWGGPGGLRGRVELLGNADYWLRAAGGIYLDGPGVLGLLGGNYQRRYCILAFTSVFLRAGCGPLVSNTTKSWSVVPVVRDEPQLHYKLRYSQSDPSCEWT